MAEILRFKAALNPRGAWDASTAYAKLDVVESGGSSYVCLQACTGTQVTNTTYWHLIAAKGAQGNPLTYADLTAAQKAELVQDATAAAQQAAASAQTAAGSAQTASQALTTIQSAIDDLDPSQSADDAVVALAARQGVLEADLSALGPKVDELDETVNGNETSSVQVEPDINDYNGTKRWQFRFDNLKNGDIINISCNSNSGYLVYFGVVNAAALEWLDVYQDYADGNFSLTFEDESLEGLFKVLVKNSSDTNISSEGVANNVSVSVTRTVSATGGLVKDISDLDSRVADVEYDITHSETQLSLSGYSGNDYNPGSTKWARNKGAHIAIPVSELGGVGAKIKLTANPYGYVCFVTSYTAPTTTSNILFANAANVTNDDGTTSMSGRIGVHRNKGAWYLTIPDNASHLIVGTKDYEGTEANFELFLVYEFQLGEKLQELETQISNNSSKPAFLIDCEIHLSDYSQSNFNMTDSGWYSVGKHKAIPVSDLGGTGITIALSTTDVNNTYCAFFTNYTVPIATNSPVYFVNHTNSLRRRGYDDVIYTKRIGIYHTAQYNYIVIPSDAVYLIINTVDGNGVDAGVKLFTTVESSLNDAAEKMHNEMLFKSSDWVSYKGEQISLKRPTMKVTRLCKTPRCQGMWYRNGYFFNCELITNSRFELYHYENNSLVLKAYWDIQSTVGHTYSEGVHGNSMQLTNIYYDQNDEFPIFTIGGNLNSQKGIMYVMRLYKDGNDEWQLVKLYDVSFDDTHFGIFALEDGTIAGLRNPLVIYNKKITAENTENIVVTSSDISYTYSTTFPDTSMPQDMVHYGNKIFLLEGDSHSQTGGVLIEPGHLMIFDMIIGKCVNDIPLIPLGIAVEPEGIDIDNEVMYIAENGENNNGYLWKLEFD